MANSFPNRIYENKIPKVVKLIEKCKMDDLESEKIDEAFLCSYIGQIIIANLWYFKKATF